VDDNHYLIAYGRIMPTELVEHMHGPPFLPDEVHITTNEVKEEFHHIFVPSPPPNGPEWLSELVGFFIKWPKHLMELREV
jgi:hypothetical protein